MASFARVTVLPPTAPAIQVRGGGVPGPPGPPGTVGPAGEQGEVGPQGLPGTIDQQYTAAQDTSALTCVVLTDASHFRPSLDGEVVYGVAVQSGLVGTVIEIRVIGELEDASWSWTPGRPIVADTLGRLTQVIPEVGFLRVVGSALTATKMLVQVQPLLRLAPHEPDQEPQEHALEAAETLSALTAVALDETNRIVASVGDMPIFGLVIQSGLAGATLVTRSGGEVTDNVWSWTPNRPVFASPTGTLTQEPPTEGVQRVIGQALSARALLVQVQPPLVLA